MNKTTTMILTN